MITLSIDTAEKRGSVALVRDRECLAAVRHDRDADYSAWLLPAVRQALAEAGTQMEQLDLLAVATGPGSFTGLRVGLTTVKAWAEVYGKPIVGVSRLEAIARSVTAETPFVAASYDAQRGQIFGALYRSSFGRQARIEDELVISPDGFLAWVDNGAGARTVTWISLDTEMLTGLAGWKGRLELGDTVHRCLPELALLIGNLAEEKARAGEFIDPLELDANYVRRSDAEIFWKDTPSRVR
jgi:tRNA threonylcarbamoyladenosine biosynthesis protein TsaB